MKLCLDLGTANRKQALFYASRARYTAYGGARGGGKSHAVRVLALVGALRYPGARILIVRRTYPELENSLIAPFLRMAPPELGRYNATQHHMDFINGSRLKFGHFGPEGEREYQGQEYDWIFIDEATQFTEREFRVLGACLRGVNDIPKRMYLTCNPGGVGHVWVKRLFVDGGGGPDYLFIPATVDDNSALMRASPDYVKLLDSLPPDLMRAHRYGDWDAMSGQYFSEFDRAKHVCEPFAIPEAWPKYRAIDYGLDAFACVWAAVAPDGRRYIYREAQRSGLIASEAAEYMLELTPEEVTATLAPPDLWSRQKDTGRSIADIFAACGAPLIEASSARRTGWLMIKELLRDGLRIFSDCTLLTANLPQLQRSEKDPTDCATEPHEITHICDALRYFAVSRTLLEGTEPELPAILSW